MRIYGVDGSFVEDGEDAFGWWFRDIIVDENVPDFKSKNARTKEKGGSTFICQNWVREERGISETKAELENQWNGFRNIDCCVPCKQKISELIQGNSLESMVLLSVVHYAKYKQAIDNVKQEDLKNACLQKRSQLTNICYKDKASSSSALITSIRIELLQLKKDFQDEEDYVIKLIKQATLLEGEIRETAYLDKLLKLLDGKLDPPRADSNLII